MKLINSINFNIQSSIPFTNNRYTVYGDGTILDTCLNKLYRGTDNSNLIINLSTEFGDVSVSHATIVAISRKYYRYPPKFWILMDVYFIDGDIRNKQGNNLVIKFPDEGIHDKNGLYLIPGYSLMRISKNGKTYSTAFDRFYKVSYSENGCGYPTVRAIPDMQCVRNVPVHILLALAFKPYPKNIDELDVNHLNGIKTDYSIDNLEWVTRKRNCEHAYSTGLRSDNIQIEVLNSITKNVSEYYSIEEAARQLSVDGETIRLRLKSEGQKVYPPGLQFKLKSSTRKWKIFTDVKKELGKNGFKKKVKVLNTTSMEETVFDSLGVAARKLGIKPYVISWNLRRKNEYKNGVYEISFNDQ